VTSVRAKFYNSVGFPGLSKLYELQLWKIEAPPPPGIARPLVNGGLAGSSLIGKGLAR